MTEPATDVHLYKNEGFKLNPKPIGRPPKYKTPEQMIDVIYEYFAECIKGILVTNVIKQKVVEFYRPFPPSIEGICAKLGISSVEYHVYRSKKHFVNPLRRVNDERKRIVQQICVSGQIDTQAIKAFLSNSGITEKQDIDLTTHEPLESAEAAATRAEQTIKDTQEKGHGGKLRLANDK